MSSGNGVVIIASYHGGFVGKADFKGPALYLSNRVDINDVIFRMPKFRSMNLDAPLVTKYLWANPTSVLASGGDFIRKSSLDELLQLWCILKGDMSFGGPRPALFIQDDLIALRTGNSVHNIVPGLTGWAQVAGCGELPIP